MITPYEIEPNAKPSQVKSVTVSAGARKQVLFKLVDGRGKARDIGQELVDAGATPPDWSPQSDLSDQSVVVRLTASDWTDSRSTLFDIEGSVENAQEGLVSFLLLPEHTAYAGIYNAEVGVFADQQLVFSHPVRMNVQPSLFSPRRRGGMTVAEVRLACLDLEVDEDSLLDELEFTDEEIYNAMRRVVDLWNQTPPVIRQYTTRTFPWREWWLRGTLAMIYDAAAVRYARDHLPYQAGGVQIDDKNKSQEYRAMAQQHLGEFMEWMRQTKVAWNMNRMWSGAL